VQGLEEQRRVLFRVMSAAGGFLLPVACLLTVFAAPLIRAGMGERWGPSASLAQWLVWAGAATAAAEIVGQMLIRIGEPRHLTAANLVKAVLIAAGFYPLLKVMQTEGVALALCAGSAAGLGMQLHSIHRLMAARWRDLARTAVPGALGSVPFLLAWAFDPSEMTLWGQAVALSLSVIASATVVLTALRWPRQRSAVVQAPPASPAELCNRSQ
jgi:O-antigen/teichoic acid export membrane protein